jgi:perosamine synthetase
VKLCDLSQDNLDFDFAELTRTISTGSGNPGRVETSGSEASRLDGENSPFKAADRLLAIVSTHLFGCPADTQRLRNLIIDPEITIIEDAAQAMGGQWMGRKLGTLADIGFFSLGRGKAYSTVEGGVVLTNRADLAERIETLINTLPGYSRPELALLVFKAIGLALFMRPWLFWLPQSIPFLKVGETIYDPHFEMRKMSAFQAGLATGWREQLEKLQRRRGENIAFWESTLTAMNVRHFCPEGEERPNLIRFPVETGNRDHRQKIVKTSGRMGLGVMPGYPDTISGIPELKAAFRDQDFPVARRHSEHLMTLPIHSFLAPKDMDRIAELLGRYSS